MQKPGGGGLKITYLLHKLDTYEKKGSFVQELGLQRFNEVYLPDLTILPTEKLMAAGLNMYAYLAL